MSPERVFTADASNCELETVDVRHQANYLD